LGEAFARSDTTTTSGGDAITLGEPRARAVAMLGRVLLDAHAGLAVIVFLAVGVAAANTGVLVRISVLGAVRVGRTRRPCPAGVDSRAGRALEDLVGVEWNWWETVGATSIAIELGLEQRGVAGEWCEQGALANARSDIAGVGGFGAAVVSRESKVVGILHATT